MILNGPCHDKAQVAFRDAPLAGNIQYLLIFPFDLPKTRSVMKTISQIPARMRYHFSQSSRSRRMRQFLDIVKPSPGMRVIDLGGVPVFWEKCPIPLNLTILNLPGLNPPAPPTSHHSITLVLGDACATPFEDESFDLAFSNSVIEHVGDVGNRVRMASEVRRLAPSYWVQTPSIWFPIEAHSMMPLWWFYPPALRSWFIARWRRVRPRWTQMMAETTVLSREEMMELFPEGSLLTERRVGFSKSYIAYKV